VPGILAVDGFVEHPIEYKGEPANIAGADLEVVAKYGHLLCTDGENAQEICEHLGANEAIITESFAVRKHVKKGDILDIQGISGTVPLKVKAIYYDYASDWDTS